MHYFSAARVVSPFEKGKRFFTRIMKVYEYSVMEIVISI